MPEAGRRRGPGPRGSALPCPPRIPTSAGSIRVPCTAVLLWREGRGGGWAGALGGPHGRETGLCLMHGLGGIRRTPGSQAHCASAGGAVAGSASADQLDGLPGEHATPPAGPGPTSPGPGSPGARAGQHTGPGASSPRCLRRAVRRQRGEPDPRGRRARVGQLPLRARGCLRAPDPAAHPSSLGLRGESRGGRPRAQTGRLGPRPPPPTQLHSGGAYGLPGGVARWPCRPSTGPSSRPPPPPVPRGAHGAVRGHPLLCAAWTAS